VGDATTQIAPGKEFGWSFDFNVGFIQIRGAIFGKSYTIRKQPLVGIIEEKEKNLLLPI
jgi:hypothetical protein